MASDTKTSTEIDEGLFLTGVVETGDEIGCGSYGKVYEVNYRGTVCAAKEIHKVINKADRIINLFRDECLHASKARHPNIVQFLGLYSPPQCDLPVMVMEKMHNNLTSLIEGYSDIPLHIKMSILHDITLGLRYLHSNNPPIVHRDLSSNNILLTVHLVAKIGDLGVAKAIDLSQGLLTETPGTAIFMPPESQDDNPVYGTPLDVFSFACIVLHVITQEWPNPSSRVNNNQVVSEIERRQKYLNKMTGEETHELKQLVIRCLDNTPTNRPNIEDVSKVVLGIKEKCVQCSPYASLNPITWQQRIEEEHHRAIEPDHETDVNQAMVDLKQSQFNDKVRGKFDSVFRKDTPLILPALCSGSCEINWRTAAVLPVPLYCTTAVVIGYKLYIVGASSSKEEAKSLVFVYDVNNDSWSKLPKPDHYLAVGENIEEALVIFGGRNCQSREQSDQVSVFSEELNNWVHKYPNMAKPRSRPSVIAHGQHVIVMGGMTTGDTVLDDIEVLNTKEMVWIGVATKLPCPMWNISTTCSDSNLFILGYADHKHSRSNKAFVVAIRDILCAGSVAVKWADHELAKLLVYRSSALSNCCTPIVLGGNHDNSYSAVGDITMYDVATTSWRIVGSMPTPRAYPIVGLVEGKAIVVAGGCSQARNKTECESSCLQVLEIGTRN